MVYPLHPHLLVDFTLFYANADVDEWAFAYYLFYTKEKYDIVTSSVPFLAIKSRTCILIFTHYRTLSMNEKRLIIKNGSYSRIRFTHYL